jgi:hypothetical protein
VLGERREEVDAANIIEFGTWLIYQLYSLDYGFFEVVDELTFKAYGLYRIMQMDRAGEQLYENFGTALKTAEHIVMEFQKFIIRIEDSNRQGLKASERRNLLAANIIRSRRDLLLHTPEANGILSICLQGTVQWIILMRKTELSSVISMRIVKRQSSAC